MSQQSTEIGSIGVWAGIGSLASRVGSEFFSWLTRIAESHSRVREIERLSAMSDAELGRLGLRRDQIVRHVFRDELSI